MHADVRVKRVKYPYIIKQNGFENTETYQVEVVYQGNVCQLEGRINFQMLRVMLPLWFPFSFFQILLLNQGNIFSGEMSTKEFQT